MKSNEHEQLGLAKRGVNFSAFFFPAFAFLILLCAGATAQTPEPQTNVAIKTAPDAVSADAPEPPPAPRTTPPAVPAENLIHFGDTLEVDVVGSLQYDWRGRPDDEGFLSGLPELTENISALCRTETEIAAEITAAYAKFLRNPNVVVRVLDRSNRQTATLFGAVRAPHRFQIQRPVKLVELVVLSGGITETASGEVQIFRPARASCAAHNQTQTESQFVRFKLSELLGGKPEANPLVKAGDVVTIEEAAPVFVTGGVAAPQRILFRAGLTVSRAVASAGGLSKAADAGKITVFRRQKTSAELEIIEIDLEKIIKKTAEDIALEPFDIIEVAQTGRARNRRPPATNAPESANQDAAKLPVRIIN